MPILGVDIGARIEHPGALYAAGKRFAARYVSDPGNPKNLSASEAAALKAAGLAVVVVFETTADRALAGRVAGQADARSADAQAAACGVKGRPIYFAVDVNATAGSLAWIRSYFAGAADAIGADRVGVYGDYAVVKNVLDARLCKYAWQTSAWSDGAWDPRAQLRQWPGGYKPTVIGGQTYDLDAAYARDYGQWPRPRVLVLEVIQGGKVVRTVRYGGGRVKAYLASTGFAKRLKAGNVKLRRRLKG